jgi:hypothetical protein
VITKAANQEMAKQDSGDQALATEVFAVNEAGGLFWTVSRAFPEEE